jgi:hypothetical protein
MRWARSIRDLAGTQSPVEAVSFRHGALVLSRAASLFLLLVSAVATAGELPDPVRDVLDEAGMPHESVGVFVQDVADGSPMINFNPDAAKNPASVMKLVTTAAALHVLGPNYRWNTVAYAGGPLNGDRLEGDLILKGFGDPLLDTEAFWTFLRRLREAGLRHVRGDLAIDESLLPGVSLQNATRRWTWRGGCLDRPSVRDADNPQRPEAHQREMSRPQVPGTDEGIGRSDPGLHSLERELPFAVRFPLHAALRFQAGVLRLWRIQSALEGSRW